MIGPYCLGSIKTTTMTLSIASFIHIKFGIWCLANMSLISHVANHSGPSLERFCEKKRSFMPSDVRRFKITCMPKEEKATSSARKLNTHCQNGSLVAPKLIIAAGERGQRPES